MARDQTERLQGTLALLVLKTLSQEPKHGWGIGQLTAAGIRALALAREREREPRQRSSAAATWIRDREGGVA